MLLFLSTWYQTGTGSASAFGPHLGLLFHAVWIVLAEQNHASHNNTRAELYVHAIHHVHLHLNSEPYFDQEIDLTPEPQPLILLITSTYSTEIPSSLSDSGSKIPNLKHRNSFLSSLREVRKTLGYVDQPAGSFLTTSIYGECELRAYLSEFPACTGNCLSPNSTSKSKAVPLSLKLLILILDLS